ncbi:hypothetical protein BIV01_00050 [Curtobacterium sp. MCBA15_013]|nr:hypothetical protein BIV01_00050 [Curtobacterium sp. MCBA15_013]
MRVAAGRCGRGRGDGSNHGTDVEPGERRGSTSEAWFDAALGRAARAVGLCGVLRAVRPT